MQLDNVITDVRCSGGHNPYLRRESVRDEAGGVVDNAGSGQVRY